MSVLQPRISDSLGLGLALSDWTHFGKEDDWRKSLPTRQGCFHMYSSIMSVHKISNNCQNLSYSIAYNYED